MTPFNLNIRALKDEDEVSFIEANIRAGFLDEQSISIAYFKKAMRLAEHVGILEINQKIEGGIMLFRRWENSLWATNIFVDSAYQGKGVSIALCQYVLDYCANQRILWGFCNPIPRIISLHRRWGIVPINSWESLSLITLYQYLFKINGSAMSFPFRTKSDQNLLQTENKDFLIQLFLDRKQLQVTDKHQPDRPYTVTIPHMDWLPDNNTAGSIRLEQGWIFDPIAGCIIHPVKNIVIYAPTASSQSLVGLTIPIDDIKRPHHWSYTDKILHIVYPILHAEGTIRMQVGFDKEDVILKIIAEETYKPRLAITYHQDTRIRCMDHSHAILEMMTYNDSIYTVYHGLSHRLLAHIIDTTPLHKPFLRSFIPKSHRPYIGGNHSTMWTSNFPLAAKLLDPGLRKNYIDKPYSVVHFSRQGKKLLHQIKMNRYATN